MNRLTELFKIKYPIIQGGMVWCSGWRLVTAVSNNGGLGLLGSGSMYVNREGGGNTAIGQLTLPSNT